MIASPSFPAVGRSAGPKRSPAGFSVLHVLPSLDPRRGGPVTAVVELVAALLEAGVPCAVATTRRGARAGAEVPVLPCPSLATPAGPILRLPADLPLPAPTIRHVHGVGALTPWSAIGGAGKDPVVASMHGVLDWRARHPLRGPRRLWHERVDRPLLARLSAFHATRPSEVEAVRALLPSADVTVLPWMLREAPALARPRPAQPFLLTIGRLHPIKGIDRCLQAMATGAMAGDERPLRLAGTGPPLVRERLARRARDLGLRHRVEFLGLLSPAALRELLAEADALVLPSRYENFGLVVLEALREGCPVVASRETPWDLLATEGAGLVADFEVPSAAAAALTATADPAWRARAGASARALYEARFRPAQVLPGFLAWYEATLTRARGGRAP